MTIIDMTKATLRAEGPDYNKFDFHKSNNKARILIPGKDDKGEMAETPRMAMAFVHSLYRSEAIMVANDKGRVSPEWENSTYAGSFHCTGEFAKVASSPTFGDPDNCPACASLHTGPRVAGAPKKQVALNVIRYQTAPNSYDVQGEGVTVELWKHGNDRNIAPIVTALKETGKSINHLDFLIETDGSAYKKLQIQFMFPAAYGKEGNEGLHRAVVDAMGRLYSDEVLNAALGDQVSKEELAANVAAAVAQATAGRPGQAEETSANPFASVAPVEATPHAVSSGATQQAPSENLTKVDVASIDSLL